MEISTTKVGGFTLIEAKGPFTHEDLFKLIGKQYFTTTFSFKGVSESARRFGTSVDGVLFYTKQERATAPAPPEDGRVKIEAAMYELSNEQREDLKYKGIDLDDLSRISFVPYNRKVERYATGEKKIPNIIEIPYEDDASLEPDLFFQNFMVIKINDGIELIPHEKEKLIGITLGINKGHIDSRILTLLGFNQQMAQDSLNISYYALRTKKDAVLSPRRRSKHSQTLS